MTCKCGCGGQVSPGCEWMRGHGARKLTRGGITADEYVVEDRGYTTPCWIWQRGKCAGYGVVKIGGRALQTHRVMYEQMVGPITAPALDHLCRNRACINPDHLEPVTKQVNSQRSPIFVRLNEDDVRAIRESTAGCVPLAAQYGVSRNQIWRIRTGKSWGNITP